MIKKIKILAAKYNFKHVLIQLIINNDLSPSLLTKAKYVPKQKENDTTIRIKNCFLPKA